jgi:hypothetical protein
MIGDRTFSFKHMGIDSDAKEINPGFMIYFLNILKNGPIYVYTRTMSANIVREQNTAKLAHGDGTLAVTQRH